MDVDALGVNVQAFFHVFHIGVDAHLRPSRSVEGHRRTQNRTMLDFERIYVRQQT